MIFAEAMHSLEDYRAMCSAVAVPVLANMTEFGQTPLCTTRALAATGVRLVLYPLSAFRAMNAAARDIYNTIRVDGTQQSVVDRMQTREELYDVLDYYRFEDDTDRTINSGKSV